MKANAHKHNLTRQSSTGLIIASAILCLWGGCLITGFLLPLDFASPWHWALLIIQTHLYTGIFITAHDAMHGTVSSNRFINSATGWLSATLFAFNWYPKLYRKHHLHHRHPVSASDPDYHKGGFLVWYVKFLLQYVTLQQIILMAITFQLLIQVFPEENVLFFWVTPSLLSTLQLFFFGTWLPHRGEHNPHNPHKARSLRRNHIVAFITCYFFGYHYEHHNWPHTPWWKLPGRVTG